MNWPILGLPPCLDTLVTCECHLRSTCPKNDEPPAGHVQSALVCETYCQYLAGPHWDIIEGNLEVKLPTIWTDEKQSKAEAERRERLEERRIEEKESEERRCRCAKR